MHTASLQETLQSNLVSDYLQVLSHLLIAVLVKLAHGHLQHIHKKQLPLL